MIVLNMNPPYEITPEVLELITSISEKIGQINATYLDKPSTKLRKENRIKTIHSSLSIEGKGIVCKTHLFFYTRRWQ
tara:strand:+ start:95 stop:325 length:231 start_codon:yes stop_codon:yes gene_type:complete